MIKAIAIDLDGTLLTTDHELSPRNEAALRQATDKGIHIIIATGKTRYSGLRWLDYLGLKSPSVFSQGLNVYDGQGVLIFQRALSDDLARRIVDYGLEHGYHLSAYSGIRIFTNAEHPRNARIEAFHEPKVEITSLRDLIGTMPINKMHFLEPPQVIKQLTQDLVERFGHEATLVNPTYELVEVLPKGASKGEGVLHALQYLGIEPQYLLALGDGDNDIEMLQLARIGVAMKNAMPRVLTVADYITDSNDNDGVAQAIEKFVFNTHEED